MGVYDHHPWVSAQLLDLRKKPGPCCPWVFVDEVPALVHLFTVQFTAEVDVRTRLGIFPLKFSLILITVGKVLKQRKHSTRGATYKKPGLLIAHRAAGQQVTQPGDRV